MIRIIIVDDEMLVKLGLKSYLSEYTDEISVLQTFSSAVDALEYMQTHEVDIVLTDIEMPDMSGISYISEIRKRKNDCGIIVISCHDSFDYAREALELGADKYLLKHEIDEDLLLKEVRSLYNKRSKDSTAKVTNADNLLDTIENEVSFRQEKKYAVAAVELYRPYSSNDDRQDYQGSGSMLYQIIEELTGKSGVGTAFKYKNGQYIVIFEFDSFVSTDEYSHMVQTFYNMLSNNLQNYIDFGCSIGVSDLISDTQSIHSAHQLACERLEQQFYSRCGGVFFHACKEPDILPKFSPKVIGFMEESWLESVKSQLNMFMESCSRLNIAPTIAKDVLDNKIHILIGRILDFYAFEDSVHMYMIPFSEIDSIQNSDMLCRHIMDRITEIRDQITQRIKSTDHIHEVLSYINENYAGMLSLKDMAQRFHMSTNYFSKWFKQKTGVGFIVYLNGLRLEKAEQLFLQRKYSTTEIADMTGFNNANYLSRVLKKMRGKTINELKSEHDE